MSALAQVTGRGARYKHLLHIVCRIGGLEGVVAVQVRDTPAEPSGNDIVQRARLLDLLVYLVRTREYVLTKLLAGSSRMDPVAG